jgi:hypothetical protein
MGMPVAMGYPMMEENKQNQQFNYRPINYSDYGNNYYNQFQPQAP